MMQRQTPVFNISLKILLDDFPTKFTPKRYKMSNVAVSTKTLV